MASALLASRAESLWCERKVYSRKHSNPNPNPNPNFISNSTPNPNPNDLILNPNPNLNLVEHSNHGRTMDELGSPSVDLPRDSHSKEITHSGTVTFNLASYTKTELIDLKRRLVSELEEVRKLRNRIENGFGCAGSRNGVSPTRQPPTVWNPIRALMAKTMEQCGRILKKLMGHKFGWVFNAPVDAAGLGLHDYLIIIHQPMDLGTVKSKFEQNVYSTPEDFAKDVRLTFGNAMKYNPKGHDVYNLASQLLGTFEKMYAAACKKFQSERSKIAAQVMEQAKLQQQKQYRVLPMPLTKPLLLPVRAPAQLPAAHVQPAKQILERSNGKLPKPKARDANKREMTFAEKQKLSMELQNLPREKTRQAVQIMKRRNAATMSENEEEVEVDFQFLDKETLWELDRFVVNYKRMVYKIKKQEQELELDQNKATLSVVQYKSPVREGVELVVSENMKTVDHVCVEEEIDIGEDEIPTNNYPPVEIEKDDVGNAGSSTDSSSSGSSSSSDSDSGSSSGGDSDGENAPKASPSSHKMYCEE